MKAEDFIKLFGARACGDGCLHFDLEKRRCAAQSVKAQSHYQMSCSGMCYGQCSYFKPRPTGEKGHKP